MTGQAVSRITRSDLDAALRDFGLKPVNPLARLAKPQRCPSCAGGGLALSGEYCLCCDGHGQVPPPDDAAAFQGDDYRHAVWADDPDAPGGQPFLPDDTGDTYTHAVDLLPCDPQAVRVDTSGHVVWRDRQPSGKVADRLSLHRDDPVMALLLIGPHGDAVRWALKHPGEWLVLRHA